MFSLLAAGQPVWPLRLPPVSGASESWLRMERARRSTRLVAKDFFPMVWPRSSALEFRFQMSKSGYFAASASGAGSAMLRRVFQSRTAVLPCGGLLCIA